MICMLDFEAKLHSLEEYRRDHGPSDWLTQEAINIGDFAQLMGTNFQMMAGFQLGWELAKDKYKPKSWVPKPHLDAFDETVAHNTDDQGVLIEYSEQFNPPQVDD